VRAVCVLYGRGGVCGALVVFCARGCVCGVGPRRVQWATLRASETVGAKFQAFYTQLCDLRAQLSAAR
jgi:hypothetical protein